MSSSAIGFLLARNRPEEAEIAARKELAKDPDDIEILLLLGISLFDQSKPKAAEEVSRSLIAKAPEFDQAHFLLARCLSEHSRNKEALKAVETALEIDPDDASYHGFKAKLLCMLGKEAEALKAADTGLAIDPGDDICRFYRSILLGKSGHHDEADTEARSLLADGPDDAENHCARGWVLQLSGDASGAERHFIEALRIDPSHEDARIGLAESLKMGNPLLGWFMKGLLWLGRVPWYYFAGGIIAANMLSRALRNLENPATDLLGKGLSGLMMSFFLILLIHVPLFNLALWTSDKGRHALSDDERRSLGWAVIPMFAGLAYLGMWWAGGLKALPFLAAACFSVAALVTEITESPRAQVRRAMAAVAILGAAVALYLVAFLHFRFLEMVLESLQGFGGDTQPEDLAAQLKEVLAIRRNYVDYPTFALFLAASFRDNLREFFEQRSDDAVS